jgi:hypothetical protein
VKRARGPRPGLPFGVVALWEIDEATGLWTRRTRRRRNSTQHGWGFIAAKLVGEGDTTYQVDAVYIEFDNNGGTVSPPSFDRDEGPEYYQNLSGGRDYLRVPLLGVPALAIAAGYESSFDTGEGNKLTFHAHTSGSTGANGLPFSDSAGSVVFGAALVATPDWDDPTLDVVFSRRYYATGEQVPKAAGRQVGVTWEHTFG